MIVKITEFVNGQLVSRIVEEPDPVEQPLERMPLSPRQFVWMLAYSGLEETWDALEAHTKDTDPIIYANLKAQRAARAFEYDLTMAFVADMRPMAAQITPDVDLSEETISAAWDLAAEQNFLSIV